MEKILVSSENCEMHVSFGDMNKVDTIALTLLLTAASWKDGASVR